MQDNKTPQKIQSISDMLKSSSRFQIYGLLNIYGEQSLMDLSKKMGKVKSTVSEHLKNLKDAGFIGVTKEIESKTKSKIKKKFYSWKKRPEDSCVIQASPDQEYTTDFCIDKLKTFKASASYVKSVLSNWIRYIDDLENRIKKENVEEICDEVRKISSGIPPFMSLLFLSDEEASEFYKSGFTTCCGEELNFKNISSQNCCNEEELNQDEIKDETENQIKIIECCGENGNKTNPYIGAFILLPIKQTLDYIFDKN